VTIKLNCKDITNLIQTNTFQLCFFFCNSGCPDQLTHTTTNPWAHWTSCKPSEYVRHRGGDRRAQWGLNPSAEKENKSFTPLGHNLKCHLCFFFTSIERASINDTIWTLQWERDINHSCYNGCIFPKKKCIKSQQYFIS